MTGKITFILIKSILFNQNLPSINVNFRIVDSINNKLYIVMEYCGGGDLSHIIKQAKRKNNDFIDEELIWKIFAQILLALHY